MAKSQKRARRRHKLDNLKKRVRMYYGNTPIVDKRVLGRLASTRTPCSCWMCNNGGEARRRDLIARQDLKESSQELNENEM